MPQVAPSTDAADATGVISSPNGVDTASPSPSPTDGSRPIVASRTTNPDDFRASRNRLLRRLSPDQLQRLGEHGEALWLAAGEALSHLGGPLSHVYFPVNATIALVAQADEAAGLQVALIGREGVLASPILGGMPVSALSARVRTGGWTWRLDADAFQHEVAQDACLRGLLDQALYAQLAEASRISACTRFHSLQARLARWLLTIADRADARTFPLRLQAMADMLGARRSDVASVSMQLQQRGSIRYHHGIVDIIDRQTLAREACDCHCPARDQQEAQAARVDADACGCGSTI